MKVILTLGRQHAIGLAFLIFGVITALVVLATGYSDEVSSHDTLYANTIRGRLGSGVSVRDDLIVNGTLFTATIKEQTAGAGVSVLSTLFASLIRSPNSIVTVGDNAVFSNSLNVSGTITTSNATVKGKLKLSDGTQGLNKFLASDAAGLSSWQTLPNPNAGQVTPGTFQNGAYAFPSTLSSGTFSTSTLSASAITAGTMSAASTLYGGSISGNSYTGAGLTTCNAPTQKLTYANGVFGCGTVQPGGITGCISRQGGSCPSMTSACVQCNPGEKLTGGGCGNNLGGAAVAGCPSTGSGYGTTCAVNVAPDGWLCPGFGSYQAYAICCT